MQSARHDQLESDLHPLLTRHEARVEADRCYFCFDAPCVTACPTGIDIPLFIRQLAVDNPRGSAKTIFDENIFGGMCARVCPTETLCEQACVRNSVEEKPVHIGQLQRYATDTLMRTGEQPYSRAETRSTRIAVVGAGPAGLACAHRLALYGHQITVFDAQPKSGGLNEYGIATYKTIDNFAQREVAYILSIGGIEVKHGQALGSDLTLASLKQQYDAVFVGIGLGKVNELGIEGDALQGVEDAVGFIARLRQVDDLAGMDAGRRVVVLGGGMTAIDAAVQVKLLGAEEVTLAYRRGQDRMNASAFEQQLAQTRGVLIRTWLQPKRLLGEAGRVSGVELEYTEDVDGKLRSTGESMIIPCDQVLKAIGQAFDLPAGDTALELDGSRLKVTAERRTSDTKIWAGGDCIAGGEDLTVAAVQDGKLAAESMHQFLS